MSENNVVQTDRNPPPPPEILQNEELMPDRIGDSLYSKKWLYKTLMSIIELCDKVDQEEEKKASDCSSVPANSTEVASSEQATEDVENENDMIELDPKIEEDACILWDMSSCKDVAEFLSSSGVPGMFLDIIDKTKSPRLLEIVVGILGNMASISTICNDICQNKSLLYSIILLSGTSDTPTLLQVLRVIECGITNKITQEYWFDLFQEHSFFMENLVFIFENSLSSPVIRKTLGLLYRIINENVEYCKMWGQLSYAKALIIAGKTLLKLKERVDNFFHVLNSLCQYIPNIENLVQHWPELNSLFDSYIISLVEDDELPDSLRITAVFSCFDAHNTLLKSDSINSELIVIDLNVLKAIHKFTSLVSCLILDIRKENMEILDLENPSMDPPRQFLRRTQDQNGARYITRMTEDEFHTWTVIADTIMDTTKTLLTYTEKENEKEILEDILSSEVVKENIGVLII